MNLELVMDRLQKPLNEQQKLKPKAEKNLGFIRKGTENKTELYGNIFLTL